MAGPPTHPIAPKVELAEEAEGQVPVVDDVDGLDGDMELTMASASGSEFGGEAASIAGSGGPPPRKKQRTCKVCLVELTAEMFDKPR